MLGGLLGARVVYCFLVVGSGIMIVVAEVEEGSGSRSSPCFIYMLRCAHHILYVLHVHITNEWTHFASTLAVTLMKTTVTLLAIAFFLVLACMRT